MSQSYYKNKLLKFYIERKTNEHIWGMRKACVDIIVELSHLSEKHEKEVELTNMLLSFLED